MATLEQQGRVDYDDIRTVLPDDLGGRSGLGAECALCAVECLPVPYNQTYEERHLWMCAVKLITDETVLFDDDRFADIPKPLHVGSHQAQLLSVYQPHHLLPQHKAIHLSWAEVVDEKYFLFVDQASTRNAQDASTEDILEKVEGPSVRVYTVDPTESPWFYVPVHDACLQLLHRRMRSHIEGAPSKDGCAWAYFDALHAYLEGHPRDFLAGMQLSDEDRQDPLEVGSYTKALVETAPHVKAEIANASRSRFEELLDHLPTELYDRIIDNVRGLANTSSTCTRLVSNSTWKRWIQDLDMLPYLWDAENDILSAARDVDWEALARQTSQSWNLAKSEASKAVATLPSGLRNRIRIWHRIDHMLKNADTLYDSSCQLSTHDLALPTPAAWPDEQFGETTDADYFTTLSFEWVRRSSQEINDWHSNRARGRGRAGRAGPRAGRSGGHWSCRWHRRRNPQVNIT